MPTHPKQTPPALRAGIYTRISWDPEGQRAGVERQRVDCEALCAARGWEIAQYHEDYADLRVMPTRRRKPLRSKVEEPSRSA